MKRLAFEIPSSRRKPGSSRVVGDSRKGWIPAFAGMTAKLAGLILLFCSFCQPASAEKLRVVATFSILGDITRQIAGDDAEITVLVGPDADTHSYEPKPQDAERLAHADILIENGLDFETWLPKLVAASGFQGIEVIASKHIYSLPGIHNGRSDINYPDPHAWQDLRNGRFYAMNIADALIAADETHAVDYRQRALAYDRKLADLDAWVKQQIGQLPASKRRLITTHDAFQYFAHAYGIEALSLEGTSTESEPSAAILARMIDRIKTTGIRAVFLENMTDNRLIAQLRQDAGAVIGGTLYTDALSKPRGEAPDYAAMFRHNVPELVATMAQNR